MSAFRPRKIYVHPAVRDHALTREILHALADVPWEVRQQPEPGGEEESDQIATGKRTWFLTSSPGQLVKECPATPVQLCCRYRTINVITNCPIDCSYCILQGYLNSPWTTIHVNLEDIERQVRECIATDPAHVFRFGTGELSDSLALEQYTGFARRLAQFFLGLENGFLEIKTKHHGVEALQGFDPQGRIGISWSMNPEEVVRREERGASSLRQRLDAARQCQEQGYLLGFHFDPLVHYPQWEEHYRQVVDMIYSFLKPERATWFSLGGFRYPGFLKPHIQERFPESRILLGELFPGPDGKYRYLKTLRIEMYQKLVKWIRAYDPDAFIYLCMESPEVWGAVFGHCPESRDELDRLFAQRIRKLWEKSGGRR
jgi:spore photoproduct lyase